MNIKKLVVLLLSLMSTAYGIPLEASFGTMTFNIRRVGRESNPNNLWHNRKTRVIDLIKKLHPDIMGLQEATIDQIKDLEHALGNGQYAWFGIGRGAEWLGIAENEYNPIFYNPKRFELITSGTFFLNPSGFLNYKFFLNPKRIGILTRICTWGQFKDKETGHEFFVYNTHFDHIFQSARKHELQEVLKTIHSCSEQLPIILMGDFNMEITSKLLNTQLKDFQNSKTVAQSKVGPDQTRTGWDFEELKEIDHILISKNTPVVVRQHMVVQESNKDVLPSDHRPVVIDIKFE